MDDLANCTLDTCPASQSIYGYRPNLGVDIFFVIVYSSIVSYCLYIISREKKGWLSYNIAIILGSLLELVGFVARIYGYVDPFVNIPWILQYTFLTIAPVFMTAAIYVCIGRLADYLGRGLFNIRPRLYARIFIPSDILALLIQSSGGGLSSSEKDSVDEGVTAGQSIIISGLALQVISLTIFFLLFLAVVGPARLFLPRGHRSGKLSRADRRVRTFVILVSVAILLIIGRSVYRTVEFSQGIYSPLGHKEVLFIILDGFPMAIATSILVLFHPVHMIPSTPRAVSGHELGYLPNHAQYRAVYT
ncbi:RTA1-domain-containing protein [Poronia punctata]|nr:RTA1-domain-containing protein [Poronia punctata]